MTLDPTLHAAAQRTQGRHCCNFQVYRPCQLPAPSPSTRVHHRTHTSWPPTGPARSSQCALGCLPLAPGLLRAVWLGEALPRPRIVQCVLAFPFPPLPAFNPNCQSVQTSHVRRAAPPPVPFASLLPTQRLSMDHMEPAHSAQSARIMTPIIPPKIWPGNQAARAL